jgi:prepilin-type processing-associated H-X9-DG protein
LYVLGSGALGSGPPGISGSSWLDFLPLPDNATLKVGTTNYCGNAGYWVLSETDCNAHIIGTTDPWGILRANGPNYLGTDHAKGPYATVCSTNPNPTRNGDISDGTSNVIAFGEIATSELNPNMGPSRTITLCWAGSGNQVSTNGLTQAPPTSEYQATGCPLPRAINNVNGLFNSKHTGVVNFSFVDGSVHALSTAIDPITYFRLSGEADGQSIDAGELSF